MRYLTQASSVCRRQMNLSVVKEIETGHKETTETKIKKRWIEHGTSEIRTNLIVQEQNLNYRINERKSKECMKTKKFSGSVKVV